MVNVQVLNKKKVRLYSHFTRQLLRQHEHHAGYSSCSDIRKVILARNGANARAPHKSLKWRDKYRIGVNTVAGLHPTSQWPCWWLRTKAFLSSGNSTLDFKFLYCKFFKKNFLTPNVAPLLHGCKQRIPDGYLCQHEKLSGKVRT